MISTTEKVNLGQGDQECGAYGRKLCYYIGNSRQASWEKNEILSKTLEGGEGVRYTDV